MSIPKAGVQAQSHDLVTSSSPEETQGQEVFGWGWKHFVSYGGPALELTKTAATYAGAALYSGAKVTGDSVLGATKTAATYAGAALYSGAKVTGGFVAEKVKDGAAYGCTLAKMYGARKAILNLMPAFEVQLKDGRTIDSELDEGIKNRLKNLDDEESLSNFSKQLADKICSLDTLKDLLPVDHSPLKKYLEFAIHRGIAKLACMQPTPINENEKGLLLTHVVKSLYDIVSNSADLVEKDLEHYIWLNAQAKAQEDVSFGDKLSELIEERLHCERILQELEDDKPEYQQLNKQLSFVLNEIEKYRDLDDRWWDVQLGREISRSDWLKEYIANERSELLKKLHPISEKIFAAAGFDASSSRLESVILKGVFGARGYFDGIESLVAEYLLDFYVEASPPSVLTAFQKAVINEANEHQDLSQGVQGLLENIFPFFLEPLLGEGSQLTTSLVALGGSSNWSQNLIKAIFSQDPQLKGLLATISSYVAPRIVEALELLALNDSSKEKEGSLLERALLNGIVIFREEFGKKEKKELSKVIRKYDDWSLKVEAYEAYKAFLINFEQDSFFEGQQLTKSLAPEEIAQIVSSMSEVKKEAFLGLFTEKKGRVDYAEIETFFTLYGPNARKEQKKALTIFVSMTEELLKKIGLDLETLIGFGKGSALELLDLDQIRNETLPVFLLEAYRAVNVTEQVEEDAQGQALKDLTKDFSERLVLKEATIAGKEAEVKGRENVSKIKELLNSFAGKEMGPSAIKMFAEAISHTSHSWFGALNKVLSSLKRWSPLEKSDLKQLDPNGRLPMVSRALAGKIFDSVKKGIVKSLNHSMEISEHLLILLKVLKNRDQYMRDHQIKKSTELNPLQIKDIYNSSGYNTAEKLKTSIEMVNSQKNSKNPNSSEDEIVGNFFQQENTQSLEEKLDRLMSVPLKIESYAVVEGSQEIQEFAEIYFSQVVERLIGKLALSCTDKKQNGLLSNALKTVLSVVKSKTDGKKGDLTLLKKQLNGYNVSTRNLRALSPEENSNSYKKEQAKQLQLHRQLIKTFSGVTRDVLMAAGLSKASDLQLLVLPFGNAKLEEIAWKNLNEQLPELLIEICRGLEFESLLPLDQEKVLKTMPGYDSVEKDSAVIAKKLVPILFGWMGRPENRLSLGHIFKDLFDQMKVEGLSRAWIEELLTQLADVQENPSEKDEIIHTLWTFVETLIAPRLFCALENVANHVSGQEGNFLQRVMAQSIVVAHEVLEGENEKLKETIIEYDELGLLADARDWAIRYLKEKKEVSAQECEKETSHLKLEDLDGILGVMGAIDENRKKALIAAIRKHVLLDEEEGLEDEATLVKFFSSLDRVGEKKSHKHLISEYHRLKTIFDNWAIIDQMSELRESYRDSLAMAQLDENLDALQRFKEAAAALEFDLAKGISALRQQMPEMRAFQKEEEDDDLVIKEFFSHDRKGEVTRRKDQAYKAFIGSTPIYDLRDKYLISQGVDPSDCKKAAGNLLEEDIQQLCQDNKFNEEDRTILEEAITPYLPKDPSDESSILLQFLRLPGSITMREKQTQILREGFGDAGDQILALAGLSSDKGFSLPGATGEDDAYYSLEYVRTVAIPQTILTLYRDMSDFRGLNAANEKELERIFKTEAVLANDLLGMFSHQIADATSTYLKSHGTVVAELAKGFFPSSEGVVAEAIQGLFSADPKISPMSAKAADEMTRFIEKLVEANALHVLVNLGQLPGLVSEEENEAQKNSSGIIENVAKQARTIRKQASDVVFGKPPESEVPKPEGDEGEVALASLPEEKSEQVSPSKLLGNVLRHVGHVFGEHRNGLKESMKIFRKKELSWELKKSSNSEKYTEEYVNQLKTKRLRQIFKGIATALIKKTGLTAKNLYCPSGLEDQVWGALTENVLPDMLAQFYLDMTGPEHGKSVDKERLKKAGLKSGPDVAQGAARYAIDLMQSMIALGGKGIVASVYPIAIKIIKESSVKPEKNVAGKLEENADHLRAVLEENLEEAIVAPEMKEVLDAISQTIAKPIVLKGLATFGENLQKIEKREPNILMKIASVAFTALADHLKCVRDASYIFNKHAYDLNHSQILSVVTTDPLVLMYISLIESRDEAKLEVQKLESKLYGWNVFENTPKLKDDLKEAEQELSDAREALNDNPADEAVIQRKKEAEKNVDDVKSKLYTWNPLVDKKALEEQLKQANNKLRIAENDVNENLKKNWNEKGEKALTEYIKAERAYLRAKEELAIEERGWIQSVMTQFQKDYEVQFIIAARSNMHEKESVLNKACKDLDAARKIKSAEGGDTSCAIDVDSQEKEAARLLKMKESAEEEAKKADSEEGKIKAQKNVELAEKAYDEYYEAYNLERLKQQKGVKFSFKPEYGPLKLKVKAAQAQLKEAPSDKKVEAERMLDRAENALNDFCDAYVSTLLEKSEMIDLSKKKRYHDLMSHLEEAEKALKAKPSNETVKESLRDAQKKFNDYRLNYYFKPLSSKLLKTIDIEQYRHLKFSDKLPISIGDVVVDQAIEKLPEILNNVYLHLSNPETLLGLMNNVLINLNKPNEELGKDIAVKIKEAKEQEVVSEGDATIDVVRKATGKMVMESMEIMPTRFKKILFNIPQVGGASQDAFEKAVGALVVEYLQAQSFVDFSDSTLKSTVEGLQKKWDEKKSKYISVTPPLSKEDAQKIEDEKPTLEVLRAEVQRRFAEHGKKLIQLTLNPYYEQFENAVKGFFEGIIRSICKPEWAHGIISAINESLDKVFRAVGAVTDVLAMPFWALIRIFLLAPDSEEAVKTFSEVNPERALMQVTNIVMNKFSELLSSHIKNEVLQQQKAAEAKKMEEVHRVAKAEELVKVEDVVEMAALRQKEEMIEEINKVKDLPEVQTENSLKVGNMQRLQDEEKWSEVVS